MTRKDFVDIMNEIKSSPLWKKVRFEHSKGSSKCDESRVGVCSILYAYSDSSVATRLFRETFCPFPSYIEDGRNALYFMDFDNEGNKLDPETAFINRLNAIALFEAQVLDYKLYKEF